MIDAIRQFFTEQLGTDDSGVHPDHELRLAASALLFEAALSDYDLNHTESALIQNLVREQFDLTDNESAQLRALAEAQAREAIALHGFTSLINQTWSPEQRLALVEKMWQVVYADGRLDDHELHLMRKIQRLLHIPQASFVAAKLRHKPT